MKIYFEQLRPSVSGSALAWRLLRKAVFSEHGISMPPVERTGTGKPYFPTRPDIRFSLSHCKTHVMCALSGEPVGADIETVRDVLTGVARKIATPSELSRFEFFELWVLKEACVKLYGASLRDMKSFEFTREGDKIIAITPDGRAVAPRLIYDVPGCMAAVCEYVFV